MYGDKELTDYLKQNFVMHWSSERPAPKITVDFGDGRIIERTITGNSLHLVLNGRGETIGVMPALMDAGVFKRFCEEAIARDQATSSLPSAKERKAAILASLQLEASKYQAWNQFVRSYAEIEEDRGIRITSKMGGQMGMTRALGSGSRALEALRLGAGLPAEEHGEEVKDLAEAAISRARLALMPSASKEVILTQSALLPREVALDYGWSEIPRWLALEIQASAKDETIGAQKVARFQQTLAQDSFTGAFVLFPKIVQLLEAHELGDFDGIVADIYAQIFYTPRSDEWLGLDDPLAWDGVIR